MNDVTGAQAQPSALSTNKVRGGVTGHHVRYVLGFGLAGIIGALSWASCTVSAHNSRRSLYPHASS